MYYDYIALITTNPDEGFHQTKKDYIARSIGVLSDTIQVHCFEPHAEGADRGCFSSHHHLWNYIVEQGFERTAIFEDDVIFLKDVSVSRYAGFLESTPDWEVFYFGHRPIIWDYRFVERTSTPGIVKVRTNDTHAYVLSQKGAQKLSARPWCGRPVDVTVSGTLSASYALFPMRAVQGGRFLSHSFFNGLSERNSQYIRYALQRPIQPLRAAFWLTFLVVAQPWFFLGSTWHSLTKPLPA
ncbi:MAG: glycosyltransferase family 25 protein [Bacteroidetes bacterium]|nr:glycosyltransferase family 25 protein [Bacteroidota bacterium]MCH8524768.1 glycosyltransferase family 25 protein [Balneolales bacterium]